MNRNEIYNEIENLDTIDKISLVENIWDSIAQDNNELTLKEWQKKELDSRYNQFMSDRIELYDIKDVHNIIKKL